MPSGKSQRRRRRAGPYRFLLKAARTSGTLRVPCAPNARRIWDSTSVFGEVPPIAATSRTTQLVLPQGIPRRHTGLPALTLRSGPTDTVCVTLRWDTHRPVPEAVHKGARNRGVWLPGGLRLVLSHYGPNLLARLLLYASRWHSLHRQCRPPCVGPCVGSVGKSASGFHLLYVEHTFPSTPPHVMIAIGSIPPHSR